MNSYELIKSDGVQISHPSQEDLVSNISLFNKYYPQTTLAEIEDFKDNSDYSSYPTLQDIVDNFDPELDSNKTFVCRVSEEYLWSSDWHEGGYDRTIEANEETGKTTCLQNLRQKSQNLSQSKGFNDDDAGTLNAYVRYEILNDGLIRLTVVKNMGNHRFVMKKIVTRNNRTEFLVKIKFHKFEENLTTDDFIVIESETHHTDADNRKNQNETQKFHSGLKAKRTPYVELFNFLKKNKINYAGIMQLERIPESDNWIQITSIQGMNIGTSYGIFSKYKTENIEKALDTMKKISVETGEKLFNNSVLQCLSSMFYSLTEDHSYKEGQRCPLMDKDELQEFIIKYVAHKNKPDSFSDDTGAFKINDKLRQSRGVKSYNYVNAQVFWESKAIVHWFKKNNGRTNGFSVDHSCMKHFIEQVDPLLRSEVLRLVS